jgi:chemotaxis protein MotA
MDIATLIGFIVGPGLVFLAIFSSPGWGFFFDTGSALIVFGGTLGAVFVNFPLDQLLKLPAVGMRTLLFKAPTTQDTIQTLVDIAEKARREGILAIEKQLNDIDDEFTRNGIRFAVDGTDPETIKAILDIDLNMTDARHQVGKSIFMGLATYAPAFGMIGTLIGLIQMLQSLDDPSQIGVGMANALVTTFYGAVIANLLAMPIAGKLGVRNDEELQRMEMVVEGILSIESGDNPRVVRDKLNSYLAAAQRMSEEKSG